ncbi:MAG TPA: hypothetical protein VFK54_04090 [Candidatus Limnocylindrales bacterium]|nr:hypothetical protein [Candidatus Limnocylindrales bacterium]
MPLTPGILLAASGIVAGLVLLLRGLQGYRMGARVADVGTSRIASLAAGEVRVHGVVEAAEVTLVSPLTSTPCVWYRATVEDVTDDDRSEAVSEERGVGFRVRDETGAIRVFPRRATVDVPPRFDERSGLLGDAPPGLRLRTGAAFGPGGGAFDPGVPGSPEAREAAIAALLTVRAPEPGDLADFGRDRSSGRRHYVEARLEPGDEVTILGAALPFGELADPTGADLLANASGGHGPVDEETAASIAEARAAGLLVSPEEAWGNAAIPGFGIGRPASAPELDPRATPPALASPAEVERHERSFDLAPDLLVLAAGADHPLVVAAGSPGIVQERQQERFLVGLLGAVLAIGSAVVLALLWSGVIAA